MAGGEKNLLNCNNNKNAINVQIVIDFVPGRPGTEEFVPGQLLLPLSRDKPFCPGTSRDKINYYFVCTLIALIFVVVAVSQIFSPPAICLPTTK